MEKVLRYLVPAFVFIVGLKILNDDLYNKYVASYNSSTFLLLFPLLGISIYSVHRTFFEIIDFVICKILDVSIVELYNANKDKKFGEYAYLKWAMIHSSLIISELGIIFSLLLMDGCIGRFKIFLVSFLMFSVSFAVYVGQHILQRRLLIKG